jgi:hypothetical protein
MVPKTAVAVAVWLIPCAEAVIVAVPPVTAVATPVFSTIEIVVGSLLVHATPLVISDLELSL